VVLIVAGIFKSLEDIERHKADHKANSTVTLVYDDNTKGNIVNIIIMSNGTPPPTTLP